MANSLTTDDLYRQLREHQEGSDDGEDEDSDHNSNSSPAANQEDNRASDGESTTLEELELEEFEAWWTTQRATNQEAGSPTNGNITMDSVRDGVVGQGTLDSYIGDIVSFLVWVKQNESDWLTNYGERRISQILRTRQGESERIRSRRVKLQVKSLLREAEVHPIVELEAITAESFMGYVMTLRNQRTNSYLSKSAYGNKRSALFHLYRTHNKIGFPEQFRLRLGNLYRGFFRELQQHRGSSFTPAASNEAQQRASHKEGKDALSVALYRALCGWFLEYGTLDGIFSHCFLVLSWNLACRSNNTARLRLNQISWAAAFDSFEVFFAHTKTDQTGEDAKYPRHVYANAHDPLVCPVFALGLYFSCCFNTPQEYDSYLFPGSDQNQRFSRILVRCLSEHVDEVTSLGFAVNDVGTHSIRKGAISYLASLVGGPPAAAICLRAGWTMGKVRDIYMRYVSSGDQFCGRALSLLPVLGVEFGASPPHFSGEWEEFGDGLRLQQFPMVGVFENYRRLTLMCLASILHHRSYIERFPVNHVARICSPVLRDASVMSTLEDEANIVVVRYPWNDREHPYSGIPPHVKVLQELTLIRNEQKDLVDGFVSKVKQAIDKSGLSGNGVTENRLQTMFDTFTRDMRQQLDGMGIQRLQNELGRQGNEHVETGRGYQWHYFDGRYHPVPKDWRFPRVGVYDAWKQWWIGDSVRNIPPIRSIKAVDLKFLDNIPLSPEERHGRTGSSKERRRPARKTYGDLKFLMDYITRKVIAAGAMRDDITLTTVKEMFEVVAHEFNGSRDAQKGWQTIVAEIRRRNKENRAQQH